MPLEVYKFFISVRSRICKETDYTRPDKGYCASQNLYYYGYKLHVVCAEKGIFQSIDITPASVHDLHYLKDVKMQFSDCRIIDDKGYLSAAY